MKNIIEAIESVYPKCLKLDFNSIDEVIEIFTVLGLGNYREFSRRVWDPTEEPDALFIDLVAPLFDCSKSQIRTLIKGGGIKVNGKVPDINLKMADLEWIVLGSWLLAVVKIGKNRFDFILM